jgi:Putative auto-transporter adhesin, head GIN domain
MIYKIMAVAMTTTMVLTVPCHAAERGYSVTSFEKIRIIGSYDVSVQTGRGVSVRSIGSTAAIEQTSIEVQGRTLIIRARHSTWGGWPGSTGSRNSGPLMIRITTPELSAIAYSGAGKLDVDAMRGARLNIAVEGPATARIGKITAETLGVSLSGAGSMTLTGRAAQSDVVIEGNATLDGAALKSADLKLLSRGSANVTLWADRSARVVVSGSGSATVLGKPACTINNSGSVDVHCGN